MPFTIERNDITDMHVDAIVNTANPRPVVGSGVDSAIHKKAGPELLKARQAIGNIDRGDAAITPAFHLPAKYVIHTVGPVWQGGRQGEKLLLASCYSKSLELARQNKCESIAFPLISTGNYGFPKSLALDIATQQFRRFLQEQDNEMQITLVVFDRESFEISKELYNDVRKYIDDHYVSVSFKNVNYAGINRRADGKRRDYLEGIRRGIIAEEEIWKDTDIKDRTESEPGDDIRDSLLFDVAPESDKDQERVCFQSAVKAPGSQARTHRKERCSAPAEEGFLFNSLFSSMVTSMTSSLDLSNDDLESQLRNMDAGFSETLLKLIDRSGKKDSEVYKDANVDRKLFSKIRNKPNYKPSKPTVVAFAFALQLSLEETKELLSRAGFALSRSSKFDVIVSYFLERQKYDVLEINNVLFANDQPILGGCAK